MRRAPHGRVSITLGRQTIGNLLNACLYKGSMSYCIQATIQNKSYIIYMAPSIENRYLQDQVVLAALHGPS